MVLKNNFIFLFILSLSLPSFADEEVQEKLEFLFKRADYENLMAEISDVEEDSSWDEDYLVFEYKALAMEKTGELDEAIRIYKKLLKKKFGRRSSRFIRAALSGKDFSLEFDDAHRMKFYYGKLTELFVRKFEEVNRGTPPKVRRNAYKKALTFIKLIRSFDDDGELPEIFKERVYKKNRELDSYNFERFYYPILSFVSWQDELFLENSDGSGRSTILNTTSGSCTGLGMKWKNQYYEWNFENCYIVGSSTVSTAGGDLSYQQSKISVTGLYGGIGLMNHSLAQDLSFGGQLNYLKRTGNWTEPDGTELENKSYLRFGFSARTTWNINNFGFVLSLGKIFGNESSHFQLATHYYF